MAEIFVPRAQEIYRHFKGGLYQVLTVAEHTETGEQLVIYQAMYGEFKIYARPLEMFAGPVDRVRYPEAEQEFRFQLQSPEGARRQSGGDQDGPPREVLSQEPGNGGGYISNTAHRGDEAGKDQAAEPRGTETELQTAESHGTESELQTAEPHGAEPELRTAESRGAEPELQTAESRGAEPELQATEPHGAEPELQMAEPRQEEPGLDPMVLEFLDARTYEQRLNVLAALHHRITNEMITTMSLCCDIEVEGDDVEQRYEELKQCLMMKERFEIKRLV